MRVLVTGGAGFIGSHLTERLVAEGHDVRVLDDITTGRRENLRAVADDIDFSFGDLRDPVLVEQLARGVEVIFHLGAIVSVERSIADPKSVAEVNLGGTFHVADAARKNGVRRVVFASSSSVYGDSEVSPKVEDLPFRPQSPYAASKAGGESLLAAYQAAFGVEAASLRFFNVYGPRQAPDVQYGAVIPRFIADGLAGAVFPDPGRRAADARLHVRGRRRRCAGRGGRCAGRHRRPPQHRPRTDHERAGSGPRHRTCLRRGPPGPPRPAARGRRASLRG